MTSPADSNFRQRLASGTAQIGMWVVSGKPIAAEICAGSGLDWLLIDCEHAPNDVGTVLAPLQAIAPYPIEVMVRPPSADPIGITRSPDIGVRNLLIPMVESAEEAAAIVPATRYPPNG